MRYRTIVADPPWFVLTGPLSGGGMTEGFGGGDNRTRELAYKTLAVPEIKALPVSELAYEDAHLYLWTTNGHLEDVYAVARNWGFKPSTMLVWSKAPMGGGLGGAWGISTEFCLYARRGSLRNTGRVVGTCFDWKRPYLNGKPQHSAKPPAFFDLVESVSPGPYLELFARRQRLGWDTWGDEALEHVTLETA